MICSSPSLSGIRMRRWRHCHLPVLPGDDVVSLSSKPRVPYRCNNSPGFYFADSEVKHNQKVIYQVTLPGQIYTDIYISRLISLLKGIESARFLHIERLSEVFLCLIVSITHLFN